MATFLHVQKSLEPDQKMQKVNYFELKRETQVKHMQPREWAPVRCPAHIAASAARGVILTNLAFS